MITVETIVKAPIEKVWECWTTPEHIVKWYHASEDWYVPRAENDLRIDGKFSTIMSSTDGEQSFDFNGIYTIVDEFKKIAYTIEGGRKVVIEFTQSPEGVKVTESFEPENVYPEELQKQGWQSIFREFEKHTENA